MLREQLNIRITNTAPEHGASLAALQRYAFPTIDSAEWFTAEMYRAQIAAFPDGQLVALAETDSGWQVAGGTTTFRTNLTFEGDSPYYFEWIGGGYLTCHEPVGEWLYGVDVTVHPHVRRMGIGTRLYEARRALVRRLKLRGELVAGLLPGYERYRGQLSVDGYVERVVAGSLTDPTLTMQLKNGFTVRRLLRGFIHDSRSDDVCALLVRENMQKDS